MSTVTLSQSISANTVKVFAREVGAVLQELVNKHGVRYRMLDGSHILLYAEDVSIRPYKISAKRPAQSTMLYLEKWIVANVPGFYGDLTAEQIKQEPYDETRDPGLADEEPPIKELGAGMERKAVVYTTGRESVCLVIDPIDNNTVYCTMCDYTQAGLRGAHLHEAKHTGATSVANGMANDARRIKQEEKKAKAAAELEQARDAANVLAHYLGVVDTEGVEQLHAELAEKTAELEVLRKERDDLKAKLAMIKEAMSL